MESLIDTQNNQITFQVQDPRIVLTQRIRNVQNKWDFLIGWDYKYTLNLNNEITSIDGFSLKYNYKKYLKCIADEKKCKVIKLNSEKVTHLKYYIKREIIKNPDILDCLIDYGYESNKDWILKFDQTIFKKIERYSFRKKQKRLTIEKEHKSNYEKNLKNEKERLKKRNFERRKRRVLNSRKRNLNNRPNQEKVNSRLENLKKMSQST